ncbi:MAG: type II toxin-antitoxin system RelE family toxin [Alkaliphilus sp.]
MINVQYSKTAFKKIKQFDKSTRTRIIDAVSKLPYGDVKRLKNDTNSAIFRLRVGKYRVLLTKDNKNMQIIIVDIDVRGEIYKKIN